MKNLSTERLSGFTLIELLVVVLIIGILAAVGLPQYQKAVNKSRSAEALAMMRSLSTGVEEYVLANGQVPTSFDQLSVVPSNMTPDGSGCIKGTHFKYCIHNGPRLQSWYLRQPSNYGFIWYPSIQNMGVSGKHFYCFADVSQKEAGELCKSIAGHDNKITSPTAGASYQWWYVD